MRQKSPAHRRYQGQQADIITNQKHNGVIEPVSPQFIFCVAQQTAAHIIGCPTTRGSTPPAFAQKHNWRSLFQIRDSSVVCPHIRGTDCVPPTQNSGCWRSAPLEAVHLSLPKQPSPPNAVHPSWKSPRHQRLDHNKQRTASNPTWPPNGHRPACQATHAFLRPLGSATHGGLDLGASAKHTIDTAPRPLPKVAPLDVHFQKSRYNSFMPSNSPLAPLGLLLGATSQLQAWCETKELSDWSSFLQFDLSVDSPSSDLNWPALQDALNQAAQHVDNGQPERAASSSTWLNSFVSGE